MLITPILHPNYSLLLNFINNSRITWKHRTERTGSRNKRIKAILKAAVPARYQLWGAEPWHSRP